MTTKEDILGRIEIRDLYESDNHWVLAINQARYNIHHIPQILLDQWKFLNEDFINDITEHDAVIISKLGTQVILNNRITELYMADDWNVLAENFSLIDNHQNNIQDNQLIKIKTLYNNDEHWNKSVESARAILSKPPPKKFINKWEIIGNESFRNRMKESDNNAVITVKIAMALGKGKAIDQIYATDDWELLLHNIKVVS